MTEIRTILFDFGNVLIDIDIPGTKQRMEAFLRTDIAQKEGLRRITPLVHAYETGMMGTDTFVSNLLQMARPDITSADIVTVWNSMLIGIPPHRLTMLEKLKENYQVLLLSNTNTLHINWIHAYMNDTYGENQFETRYFHHVYFSHEIGYRKPQESAFLYVVEDAGITPSGTLFIDDMAENIHTAASLGFQTYHISPEEEILEVLRAKGIY